MFSPSSIPEPHVRRGAMIGDLIGDYRIVSEAGRGGMGTVYKAVDRQGREVAIKIIGGAGVDRRAGLRERNRVGLIHEARVAAGLHHPNIVEVLDLGREGETLYVVMEYLEGISLNRYIRNHRLGVFEGLRIVAELCDAISYAHSRDIVHRDIKPANIFITANKTVKVLDFGLACQGDELKDRPSLAGTLPYMSPEQFNGKDVDARSDIWSAGVTLFEILTGRCPFVGENLSSLRSKIVGETLPKISSELPCARELEAVLEKALAKNREVRYQTAAEFGLDLRSLMLKIRETNSNSSVISSPVSAPNLACSEKLDEPPERTLPTSKPMVVDLGFASRFRSQVFVVAPPKKQRRVVVGDISGLKVVGQSVLTVLGFLAIVARYYWAEAVAVMIAAVAGVLLILAILAVTYRRAYGLVFCPQVLRCRSCQRRMRTTNDFRRSVWVVDRKGFCVADCLTALKEDHWEDAVTLLLLHTTAEPTDVQYRLMFLECKSCKDQRAYFWFFAELRDRRVRSGLTPLWSEAYKFYDPRKAQEFAEAETLRMSQPPTNSVKNAGDVHDQMTI